MSIKSIASNPVKGSAGFSSGSLLNSAGPIPFQYLVIAGGGGSSVVASGGGGAGGYRCSVAGELTGGGGAAETNYFSLPGQLLITVGAGGASQSVGSFSRINSLTAIGGGCMMDGTGSGVGRNFLGGSGSGGGARSGLQDENVFGFPINAPLQGHQGGRGVFGNSTYQAGGGGGGAGGAGAAAPSNSIAGAGGVGLASSITLSSVFRGGGGAGNVKTGSAAAGGNGGGGGSDGNGAANTGGGAGGGTRSGGSGVVIIRYPAGFPNLSVGSGLVIDNGSGGNVSGAGAALAPSFSNATWKVYMFKSGTGTVTL